MDSCVPTMTEKTSFPHPTESIQMHKEGQTSKEEDQMKHKTTNLQKGEAPDSANNDNENADKTASQGDKTCEEPKSGAHEAVETAQHSVQETATSTKDKAKRILKKAKTVASHTLHDIKDLAQDIVHEFSTNPPNQESKSGEPAPEQRQVKGPLKKAKRLLHKALSAIVRTLHDITEKAEKFVQETASTTRDTTEATQSSGQQSAGIAMDQSEQTKRGV